MVGVATWMNTAAFGALGLRRGFMFTSSGSRSPLRRLQGAQQVTMLSQPDEPPFERGMTWSTVSVPRPDPQYWQVQRSRAKIARRVIFRRCASRGTFTYVTSLMTTGCGRVRFSDRRLHSERSRISALCFRTSTAARRTVQTFIGSNDALSTSTRPGRAPRSSGRRAGSAVAGAGSPSPASTGCMSAVPTATLRQCSGHVLSVSRVTGASRQGTSRARGACPPAHAGHRAPR
jgi:hypothetical protein